MPRKPSDADFRARLTPEQYRVTQEGGTERAFTGELYRNERTGRYPCVACGEKPFASGAKYESGSGWPSFWQPASPTSVADSAALDFKPEPGS